MRGERVLFDPEFMINVASGWGFVVLGALILLAAGIWWSASNPPPYAEKAPRGWRALTALGWTLFLLGWVWQIVGYARIGVGRFGPF
jgi:hypothetical protein